jgi:hypothetical protein
MSASDDKTLFAWQPLTPRGVAAFARASFGRLLLAQLIVALIAAGAVVWFLRHAWFPTVSEAVRTLPTEGAISSGRLDWPAASPAWLAEGRFLALVVDLEHAGEARSPAHVQIEFGRTDFKAYSLFGSLQRAYPLSRTFAFNRTELLPWWGAWAPVILAIVAGAVVAGLMATWACLATLYTVPVVLIAFFANRDCNLAGSWRVAGAALMPGALLMCAALLLYGWGAFDLVRLMAAGAAHLVIGWGYVLASPLCLPRNLPAQPKDNPFS